MPNPQSQTNTAGRVPPQAVEAEEAVLGSMLLEEESIETVTQILNTEDFYKPAHRHIYSAMMHLLDKSERIDLMTLEQTLRDKNQLDQVGGPNYLADLTRSVASAANVGFLAGVVAEKSVKRQFIIQQSELINEAYDPGTDVNDILNKADTALSTINVSKNAQFGQKVSEYVPGLLEEVETAYNNPNSITGVPTGLDLDKFTAGWQPGDLVIIAARPSMGKTALVLNMAEAAATYSDERLRSGGLIISLEMSGRQLTHRFAGIKGKINSQYVRTGKISKQEFEYYCTELAALLYELDIIIDDTPAQTLRDVGQKIRHNIKKHNIGWVAIDFLQLMYSGKKTDNRNQEVGMITRGLKELAKQHNIPILLLSQLSRQVEMRSNKRPQLSDLRDSGEIEQDADLVLFLYRPEYYGVTVTESGQSTQGLAEVIIAKHRNGPVASVMLNFQKEYGIFSNLAYRPDPDEPEPQSTDNYATNSNYRSPLPPGDMDDDPGF
jgi:replicative DNA helicase